MTMICISDLERLENMGYSEHHTSRCRGYVSRKIDGVIRPYRGKFGEGYAVLSPAWDSTTYCYITYYIKH